MTTAAAAAIIRGTKGRGGDGMDIVLYGALGPEGQERRLAYVLLKQALVDVYGLAELPAVARCPGGKPWFPQYPQIHFNLSHTAGAAVCALHDQAVGVDVERLRPPPVHLARGMAAEPFFREWTAREAAVKRRGGSALALRGPFPPEPLCRPVENLLPGCVVAVCPSEPAPIRAVRLELGGSGTEG